MTPLEGKFDFRSVYMVDYVEKKGFRPPAAIPPPTDNCLIVGLGRDALKTRDQPETTPDVLCPINKEYYKTAVDRVEDKYPKVVKNHFKDKEIDPLPIEEEKKDQDKSEYFYEYCDKDQPFVSINMTRRAKASQKLHLPDDTHVPETTHRYFFRPPPEGRVLPPGVFTMRPEADESARDELRRIQRVHTGDTTYGVEISQLGGIILRKAPYGPCKESPFKE